MQHKVFSLDLLQSTLSSRRVLSLSGRIQLGRGRMEGSDSIKWTSREACGYPKQRATLNTVKHD